MKVGIFGNNYQTRKQQVFETLFAALNRIEAEIWVEKHFYNYLSKQFPSAPKVMGLITAEPFPLDMVISLGGDGTFLRSACWVNQQLIPILGINTGRLGFLADINAEDIEETIQEIVRGEYRIEDRSVLKLENETKLTSSCALNEVAILKRDSSSMINIQVSLNGEFLADYLADGLLIATPTGSTAYNLSVNGPIILPQSNNFVISPVASHSLNMRPLVIPETSVLSLKVKSRSRNFLVSLDGRSEVLQSGSEFKIEKANFPIRIIKRNKQSFYDTLRRKLYWGSDIRNEQ